MFEDGGNLSSHSVDEKTEVPRGKELLFGHMVNKYPEQGFNLLATQAQPRLSDHLNLSPRAHDIYMDSIRELFSGLDLR